MTETGQVAPLVDGLSTLDWQVGPSVDPKAPADRHLYVGDAIRAMRFPATLALGGASVSDDGARPDSRRAVSSDIVRGRLGLGLAGPGSPPQIKLGVSLSSTTAELAFVDCFHDERRVAGVQRPFGPLSQRLDCPRAVPEEAETHAANVWIEAFAPPHRPISELSSVGPVQGAAPGTGCDASRWLEQAPPPNGTMGAAIEWLEQAAPICRESPASERHREAVEQVLEGLRPEVQHGSAQRLDRAALAITDLALRSDDPHAWEGLLRRLAELAPHAVAPIHARVRLLRPEEARPWCHDLRRSLSRSQQALACFYTVAGLDPDQVIDWPIWSSALAALPRVGLREVEAVVARAGHDQGVELLDSITSCLAGAPAQPFAPPTPGASPGTSAILVGLSDNHPMSADARRCVLSRGAAACLSELAGGHDCAAPHAIGRYLRVAPAREHEAWARAARESAGGRDVEPAPTTAVRASFHAAVAARELAQFAADEQRANQHEVALVDALRVLQGRGPTRWGAWRHVALRPLIGASDTTGWACCSNQPPQSPLDVAPGARPLVGSSAGPALTISGLILMTITGAPLALDAIISRSGEPPIPDPDPDPDPEPEPEPAPRSRDYTGLGMVIGVGIGAGLALTGLVIWLSDPDEDDDAPSVPVQAGPDGAQIGIRIPF